MSNFNCRISSEKAKLEEISAFQSRCGWIQDRIHIHVVGTGSAKVIFISYIPFHKSKECVSEILFLIPKGCKHLLIAVQSYLFLGWCRIHYSHQSMCIEIWSYYHAEQLVFQHTK